MKFTRIKEMSKGPINVVCEPGDGTRYDLMMMEDPNGGTIVSWHIMGAMLRYYSTEYLNGGPSEIKVLTKKWTNKYDHQAIHQIMDSLFKNAEKWGFDL
jgi:hypothetical protein